MSDEPFIVFGRPEIGEEEIAEVEACMRSGWLGTGPRVARFESDFAAYKGVSPSQVAAVNSCTAALHISMVAAGLSPGAEVITTPLTFCATVNAIIHAGLTPVLADVDPTTQCIDPSAIEAAITPRTEAIVPVHFAGRPCDMDRIMAIAGRHGLAVIEDCAHAVETEYKGKKAGTFGDFGCFSFYVTKNVVTGEGGMILGRSEEQIARARILALHGMSKDAWHRFSDQGYKHYDVVECGFKYNMMDIQAAIGIHQLARVQLNLKKRESIWKRYQEQLSDLPISNPAEINSDECHSRHLFTIMINAALTGMQRDDFIDRMHRKGVGVGVHYLSIPEHSYYQQRFGWSSEAYPVARNLGRSTASIPLSASLSGGEIERIIGAVTMSIQAD